MNAFNGNTSLINVAIPNSVTTIQGLAFSSCTNLTTAIPPGSIISIGGDSFFDCFSLTNIVIPAYEPIESGLDSGGNECPEQRHKFLQRPILGKLSQPLLPNQRAINAKMVGQSRR